MPRNALQCVSENNTTGCLAAVVDVAVSAADDGGATMLSSNVLVLFKI